MTPITALVLTVSAIAGFAVFVGSWIDRQRKDRRAMLERQLLEAPYNGDCGEIARLIGELRSL